MTGGYLCSIPQRSWVLYPKQPSPPALSIVRGQVAQFHSLNSTVSWTFYNWLFSRGRCHCWSPTTAAICTLLLSLRPYHDSRLHDGEFQPLYWDFVFSKMSLSTSVHSGLKWLACNTLSRAIGHCELCYGRFIQLMLYKPREKKVGNFFIPFLNACL